MVLSKVVDGSVISEKLCRINPSEVLSKLELPIEFRKILQDILADRYLNEHLVEAEKLKEELHRQRIYAENGASSLNSHIASLIGGYRREEKFCKDNFILCDFNSASEAVKRNIVIGILNSHATKDSRESPWSFGNTKLETLDAKTTSILISSLQFSELEKIFRQYKITSLSLDEKGKEYVKDCVLNLKDNSFEIFWCDLVRERLTNLLYILSLVHVDEIDIDVVYSIIKWMLHVPITLVNMAKFVPGVIAHNPPTAIIAQELLDVILTFEDNNNRRLNGIVKCLCNIVAKSSLKINILEKLGKRDLPVDIIIHLADIVPSDNKKDYFEWAIPQLNDDFLYYVLFHHFNKLLPEDITFFKNSLMSFSNEFAMNYGSLGSIIASWRENPLYSSLWEIIDECAKTHPYLKFAINPLDYDDKENVHPEWIKALGEAKVKKLIQNPIYNNILLRHIAFENYSAEDRLKLLSVYLNEDIDLQDESTNEDTNTD